MTHYHTFMKDLEQQGIVLQPCNVEQRTSHDSILGYQVKDSFKSILEHVLHPQEQIIYIFVESGADCVLHVHEHMQKIIEEKSSLQLHVILAQDAQFTMNFSFVHAAVVDCSIHIYLEGDRAKAEIQGLYALSREQKVSIKTYQYHAGVDTYSNLLVKGMLTDNAQATYHGLIKVDESAKRADASQIHKNITLSSKAHVISIPTIEVLQYDVQCCHGSAIGKFDQADMWYLQSKGIMESQAQALLVRSFFQDVLTESNNQDEKLDMLCQKMK